ncbi:hypothetical protein HDU97_007039 [Phlyctochytrium planicorne]|nr:hypothetical protein HDU97_007039 [Phlyctochytrium planicorne]
MANTETTTIQTDKRNGSSLRAEAAAMAFELRRSLLEAQIKEFEKQFKNNKDTRANEKIQILQAALKRHDLKVFKKPGCTTTFYLDINLPITGYKQLSLLTRAFKEAGCQASRWETLSEEELGRLLSLKDTYDGNKQSLAKAQNEFEHAVRVGVASRKAFQLRREILEDYRAIINSGWPYGWYSYTHGSCRMKKTKVGVQLIDSALKRTDLKVDLTLPEAERWDELLKELLPWSKQRHWSEPLVKVLKEAGCSVTIWEDLTAEDISLLFAQDRALELQFPHHKGDPADLDPAALFNESFVARVSEKAKVAEKKTATANQAAAAARQKKGVTANMSHMKGASLWTTSSSRKKTMAIIIVTESLVTTNQNASDFRHRTSGQVEEDDGYEVMEEERGGDCGEMVGGRGRGRCRGGRGRGRGCGRGRRGGVGYGGKEVGGDAMDVNGEKVECQPRQRLDLDSIFDISGSPSQTNQRESGHSKPTSSGYVLPGKKVNPQDVERLCSVFKAGSEQLRKGLTDRGVAKWPAPYKVKGKPYVTAGASVLLGTRSTSGKGR